MTISKCDLNIIFEIICFTSGIHTFGNWQSRKSSLTTSPQRSSNTRRTPAPSRRIFSPAFFNLFAASDKFLGSHIVEAVSASLIQSSPQHRASVATKFARLPPNSPQKHLCHFRSFHYLTLGVCKCVPLIAHLCFFQFSGHVTHRTYISLLLSMPFLSDLNPPKSVC